MEKQIKVKSIAFNLDDPHQYKLFTHSTNTTNFSSYIKSLIQRDMEGNSQPIIPQQVVVKESNELDLSHVRGLI